MAGIGRSGTPVGSELLGVLNAGLLQAAYKQVPLQADSAS